MEVVVLLSRTHQKFDVNFFGDRYMASAQPLVWIDLEMTGLDQMQDHILEIAVIITDSNLVTLHPGLSLVVHQPDAVLEAMSPWCQEHHLRSGLLADVAESTVTVEEAQTAVLEVVKNFCAPQRGVLCGNTIYQDRAFLRRCMPELDQYLHYRLIDVSSVKELVARWYPRNPETFFKKSDTHRALADIQESILELQHYRSVFFV